MLHVDLAEKVLNSAQKAGFVISTAESCTGGLISAALTAIPGSSRTFDRGFVTYSNDAKRDMLGVHSSTLDTYGAVSENVAIEMAQGALTHSNAQIAVSVTGIAGPGGSDHKPEGRVCFGLAIKDRMSVSVTVEFGAIGRNQVREATVHHALSLILEHL